MTGELRNFTGFDWREIGKETGKGYLFFAYPGSPIQVDLGP